MSWGCLVSLYQLPCSTCHSCCIVLCCIVLHLHCVALYCVVLYCICIVLHCIASYVLVVHLNSLLVSDASPPHSTVQRSLWWVVGLKISDCLVLPLCVCLVLRLPNASNIECMYCVKSLQLRHTHWYTLSNSWVSYVCGYKYTVQLYVQIYLLYGKLYIYLLCVQIYMLYLPHLCLPAR